MWGPSRPFLCFICRPEEYESGSTGGERCDGEEGEEAGVARVDRIYVLNADLKSMTAAAQVVIAVMGR